MTPKSKYHSLRRFLGDETTAVAKGPMIKSTVARMRNKCVPPEIAAYGSGYQNKKTTAAAIPITKALIRK
jgi:hypothetical protein